MFLPQIMKKLLAVTATQLRIDKEKEIYNKKRLIYIDSSFAGNVNFFEYVFCFIFDLKYTYEYTYPK